MNMYEIIRRRYNDGELTRDEVIGFAKSGILSLSEAKLIIAQREHE